MTYNCTFKPSKTNGHWHQTQDEASRCIQSWAKWNKPKNKKPINDYSNRPAGSQPDMDSRSFL